MLELFYDTETTGRCDFKAPHFAPQQPDIIQLACILSDENTIYSEFQSVINPKSINENYNMEPEAAAIHGITDEMITKGGISSESAMEMFTHLYDKADITVCHNVQFDRKLVGTMFHRCFIDASFLKDGATYCTMLKSVNLCKLPGKYGYKWPKLEELHRFLFNEDFDGAHDAMNDVRATRRCYYEMKRRGL